MPAPGNGAAAAASSWARARSPHGDEAWIRARIRQWIVEHTKVKGPFEITDRTAILEEGLLTSLDIVEFVLFLEELRGAEIEADDIDPDVFTCVDTLWEAFFANR